jgi:Protein of unknown function (DUF3500)
LTTPFARHAYRAVLAAIPITLVLAADAAVRKQTAAAMADGASKFLASLSAEQRQKASFGFDDQVRFEWFYTPVPRKGLPLKELDDKQRELAMTFLKTGVSARGFEKATTIIGLETVLGELEAQARAGRGGGQNRDPGLYYFSVFGTPSPKSPWGWRVEGHHLSLNFTVVNGELIAASPSFFGVNPAEVPEGPRKGFRALPGEEDRGRELFMSLNEAQRAEALLPIEAPRDMITTNTAKVDPLAPGGIAASKLTPAQKALLRKLIDEYASSMAPDLAADRLEKLEKAGFDKLTFAWAGSVERLQPHYYRVQGPTMLIEYDNTQNRANHIHSVWRDFDGDFGRDLIRDHYRAVAH